MANACGEVEPEDEARALLQWTLSARMKSVHFILVLKGNAEGLDYIRVS